MTTSVADTVFARRHRITWDEAVMYRHGRQARARKSPLIVGALASSVDAWYAAGWHDEDMDRGASVLRTRLEGRR